MVFLESPFDGKSLHRVALWEVLSTMLYLRVHDPFAPGPAAEARECGCGVLTKFTVLRVKTVTVNEEEGDRDDGVFEFKTNTGGEE